MWSFSPPPSALASIVPIQFSQALAQKTDEEELSAVYGDKTTVAIAAGKSQPLRRAPALATVTTAEEISAMGAHDLDEVLESVPGMHVSVEALLYGPKYALRGIGVGGSSPTKIPFMLNGAPITTSFSQNIGVSFARTPVTNISRIEAIRDLGSALYGADAYAGFVNVVTKSFSDTLGAEIGLHIGTQQTKNAWFQYGGKIGSIGIAAFVSTEDTGGINEIINADAATRNDGIFKKRSSMAPGLANNWHKVLNSGIDFVYENYRRTYLCKARRNSTGAGTVATLNNVGYSLGIQNLLSLAWNDRNFRKDLALGASHSFSNSSDETPDRVVFLPAGTKLPTGLFPNGLICGPNRWEIQLRFSAFTSYTELKDHQIRIGHGHDDLNLYKAKTFKSFFSNAVGTPVPNGSVEYLTDIQPHIRPTRRKVGYINLQNEWGINKDLALIAGVRHDQYSYFGRTTAPLLALVCDTSKVVTAKRLFGREFRASSFN